MKNVVHLAMVAGAFASFAGLSLAVGAMGQDEDPPELAAIRAEAQLRREAQGFWGEERELAARRLAMVRGTRATSGGWSGVGDQRALAGYERWGARGSAKAVGNVFRSRRP